MCNFENVTEDTPFGYIVDTPEIRALIEETQRLMAEIPDDATRVKALEPVFSELLAAEGWLPEEYASPDEQSVHGECARFPGNDEGYTPGSQPPRAALAIPAGAAVLRSPRPAPQRALPRRSTP